MISSSLIEGDSTDYFAAQVTGNCMAPDVQDGDVIVASRSGDPKCGQVVVVEYQAGEGKAMMVKRYMGRMGGDLMVAPDNAEGKTNVVFGLVIPWLRFDPATTRLYPVVALQRRLEIKSVGRKLGEVRSVAAGVPERSRAAE